MRVDINGDGSYNVVTPFWRILLAYVKNGARLPTQQSLQNALQSERLVNSNMLHTRYVTGE